MLFQRPKRVAILRAGLELFANRGYQRTNIAEIARCAGATLDTFYKYFGSKEQLARVMYEDVERERDCYLEVLPPADASLRSSGAPFCSPSSSTAAANVHSRRSLSAYRVNAPWMPLLGHGPPAPCKQWRAE